MSGSVTRGEHSDVLFASLLHSGTLQIVHESPPCRSDTGVPIVYAVHPKPSMVTQEMHYDHSRNKSFHDLLPCSTETDDSDTALPEAQLQLDMGGIDRLRLRCLKKAMEAASLSEVVRRSLQAYELCDLEPFTGVEAEHGPSDAVLGSAIHVRIPGRTKERLEYIKDTRGMTYSQIVSEALTVMGQLLEDREKLRRAIARGDTGPNGPGEEQNEESNAHKLLLLATL